MYLVFHLILATALSLALFSPPVLAEELVVTNSPASEDLGPCTKNNSFKFSFDFAGETFTHKATCPRGAWNVIFMLSLVGQQFTVDISATEIGSGRTCSSKAFSPVGGVEQFHKHTTTCDSGPGQPKIALETKRQG